MTLGEVDTAGYLGPSRVLTPAECRQVMRVLRRPGLPQPHDWIKGHAASSRIFYELATRREVLGPVVDILGDDVVLWGASMVVRAPGQVHPYHVDIETSDPASRTLTVWIGLENTTKASSLRLVAGSHRFGAPAQQVAAEKGVSRGSYDADDVMGWAVERDPQTSLVELDMTDGEAIWFDGHLWHGSLNESDRTRSALLLQYATADTPMHIPDFARLEWPFRLQVSPRPPCIVVSGRADPGVNRIVPAPAVAGEANRMLSTWIRELDLPLPRGDGGFELHPIFKGSTPNLASLGCHVSVLDPGVSPHPPHRHPEEEILVVLDGDADLVTEDGGSERAHRVGPGTLAYYPAGHPHTIRGAGDHPVTYMMFKWADEAREGDQAPAAIHDTGRLRPDGGERGFGTELVFEGPTGYLAKLHCHLTELSPGGGYRPHADSHDVAIIALEGSFETIGSQVSSPAVVFYSGGQVHGMHNPTESKVRYLVAEFHRSGVQTSATGEGLLAEARGAAGRVARSLLKRFPRAKRVLKRLIRR